jgi:hypothetical protein
LVFSFIFKRLASFFDLEETVMLGHFAVGFAAPPPPKPDRSGAGMRVLGSQYGVKQVPRI